MRAFLDDDFLLNSETARRLYHGHAKQQPIVDYHTHLSAADIAADRRFGNLAEIWLEGDHYKWRAMRANGVAERFCTGNASPYEKFQAWASTVPNTVRNPLYHWTHLELCRCFGISESLNTETAQSIWDRANEALQSGLTTQPILRRFCVEVVCTTDDPVDDLKAHRAIASARTENAASSSTVRGRPRVLPTFRPDRALKIDDPIAFLAWLESLREASNIDINGLATLLDALRKRHDYFNQQGCRASDHGLSRCHATVASETSLSKSFSKVLAGHPVSAEECESYATFLMLFFGHLNSEKGWVQQLHLGARRNLSTTALRRLGADTGFDAIGDELQGRALAEYLDLLQRENALPRTVLYNSNPADNYLFATIASSFYSSDGTGGAVQYGPAWWFLDQKDGIVAQLNALSSVGLLSRFVGMTTDSRSFVSFPRHEYFRRILCDLVGGEIEQGELPDDERLIGGLIADLCSRNATTYFGLDSSEPF
jgi:glucuronate isomerase